MVFATSSIVTNAVPIPSDAFGGDSLGPLRKAPKVMVVACAGRAKKQTRGRTGSSQAFFMNVLPLAVPVPGSAASVFWGEPFVGTSKYRSGIAIWFAHD